MKADFYAALRNSSAVFPRGISQMAVDGMEGILSAFATHGDGRDKTLAYALATAYHETGALMVPVREGFAKTDGTARRIVSARKYGAPAGPYGHVYYGRGHVQLTWLDNYRTSSADAGVDLVKDPDAMLDPVISARVLVKGLLDGRWNGQGKGIAFYLPTSGKDDLRGARRTVNITDKWELIGGYYGAFLAAIRAAGGVEALTQPKVVPVPTPKPVQAPEPAAEPSSAGAKAAAAGVVGIAAVVASFWHDISAWIGSFFQ